VNDEKLTPKRIVSELNSYIVGQDEAKRSVAIALRNRWRRRQTSEEMSREILPKNIIMIGPTGVGKTEIARRLANLVNAPFVKVEASKYTEVGYHGRDVESMVRELADVAINMVRSEIAEEVRPQAEENAEARLLDRLYEPEDVSAGPDRHEQRKKARDRLLEMLRGGKLEDRVVEIEVYERPVVQGIVAGGEEIGVDMQELFEQMLPTRSETRRMSVSDAREIIVQQEIERLIDRERLHREAVQRCQDSGIIFIDEIDKVTGKSEDYGPGVSRQGVQRDLLPIVEGSSVPTRYGMVRTDHILFIAAGAFTVAKPTDLIPELQGRFPIRVELEQLDKEDFKRILVEPRNALTRQYVALLGTEGVELDFTEDAIDRIAGIAEEANRNMESIGARRLQTVLEKLVEELSFNAPEMGNTRVRIDASYVDDRLGDLLENREQMRYIL
jgi:ATP-dependent HslUV protease ATP-binding subunit HslU